MNTNETQETAETYATPPQQEATLWQQADEVVRENPIPVIFTAVALGFGLGLLFRSFESERPSRPIRDCLDETSDVLSGLFRPIRKKSSRAAHSMRDAVENAMDRAREMDVDPLTRWWRRLW